MKKIRSTAFLCLLLYSCCSFAQQQKKYLFTRYGKANGLAADVAFSVAQDRQGYIWIATEQGLQRYDGKRFLTFHHNPDDRASIPANSVQGLYLDKKGRLWVVLFGNKIGSFDTRTFRYSPAKVLIPDEFKRNNIQRFGEDEDGTLHFSVMEYGMLTYNEKLNEFSSVHNIIQPVDGSNAFEIYKPRPGNDYLLSSRNGFDLYNSKTRQWAPRNSNNLLKVINRNLTEEKAMGPAHIFTDRKGRTWLDMWLDGKKDAGPVVYCYNPAGDLLITHKKSIAVAASGVYHSISGFLEQKNGDIWIHGTALFARFNEEKQAFEDFRNESFNVGGIDMETIYHLYEDREGNIWISGSNGLFMFNPGKQVFSNLPNKRDIKTAAYTNSVEAVMQAKNGIIYSSTWGAGIFTYDSNFNVIPNPIVPLAKDNHGFSGWDMHERKNGEIWIAMQGGSIRIYNQHTKKTVVLKLSVFENRTVRQVAEDSLGNMWMGTQYGGIIKCINANWQDTARSFKLVQNLKGRIAKIVTDKNGFVWVCTDRFGLYKLNASDGSIAWHYDDESPEGSRLLAGGAGDIFQYNDSIFLVASGGLNVLNAKTNKISHVNIKPGPESSTISSIIKDRQGYIWLALTDGLCRMEYGKNIFVYFDSEDGIRNNHFQLNASTLLNDGRILLGTTTDLLVFDPSKISPLSKKVQAHISGLMLADRDLPVDSLLQLKKVTLPYYNNSLTVFLTTFSFKNDDAILYKLEGIDEKWLFSSSNRITYNRLSPGTYRFKAKAVSTSGEESDTITELIIDIIPPFWKTWWFYGLVILGAIGIFYLADRERLLRIKTTQKLRADIAVGLHHDVNTALNNINLLSEMARIKADRDILKSKELIEQISDKSNDMIIAMDDMLWVIDPANDSMEKTILRINEFIDALRNRHMADIEVQIDEKVKRLKLDMKLRHGFFFIFKSALRCMVQYSEAKQTIVNIELQKSGLTLKMKSTATLKYSDTNIMNCWEDMKRYAADISAELDVQNDKYESNIFLRMPVK